MWGLENVTELSARDAMTSMRQIAKVLAYSAVCTSLVSLSVEAFSPSLIDLELVNCVSPDATRLLPGVYCIPLVSPGLSKVGVVSCVPGLR